MIRQLPLLLAALAAALFPTTFFAQNCSGGGAASTAMFALTGKLSMDEKDDPSNQKGTLTTSAGKIVAVQYTAVNFGSFVPDSYCNDVAIDISSAGSNNFLYFSTVELPPCTDLPKSAFINWFPVFSGGVPTNGTNVWELYEVFDEAVNAADAVYTSGTFKIFVCPAGQFLPIVLTTFYGKSDDRHNVLIWETATEVNVQNQVLERSRDASVWAEIGRFDGGEASMEAKKYQVLDENPLSQAYYRLRTVDCDGSWTVSKLVFIDRGGNQFEVSQVSPNPISERATVVFTAQKEAAVLVKVIATDGRPVIERSFEAASGENRLPIDLNGVRQGVYFVSVVSGEGVSSPVRFVKNGGF